MEFTPLETQILSALEKESISDTGAWTLQHGIKHDNALVGALLRLEGVKQIKTKLLEKKSIELSEEAQEILKLGSAEVRTWKLVPKEGMSKADLEAKLGDVAKIGFSQAMKNKWISFDSKTGIVTKQADTVQDTTKEQIEAISKSPDTADANIVANLKKRKLASPVNIKTFEVTKGENFGAKIEKAETDLSSEIISSGSWKNKTFKNYNFDALGTPPGEGHLHPLLKVRSEYREIFLEMGFEEMPTNNWVESSFWNFDALFQPQQHPARDAHDTFFLSDPAETLVVPEDFMETEKNA